MTELRAQYRHTNEQITKDRINRFNEFYNQADTQTKLELLGLIKYIKQTLAGQVGDESAKELIMASMEYLENHKPVVK